MEFGNPYGRRYFRLSRILSHPRRRSTTVEECHISEIRSKRRLRAYSLQIARSLLRSRAHAFAASKYMAGNYNGFLPPDYYAHSSVLGFDALSRLAQSIFYNVMTPERW
jgi:hypothetical protein